MYIFISRNYTIYYNMIYDFPLTFIKKYRFWHDFYQEIPFLSKIYCTLTKTGLFSPVSYVIINNQIILLGYKCQYIFVKNIQKTSINI